MQRFLVIKIEKRIVFDTNCGNMRNLVSHSEIYVRSVQILLQKKKMKYIIKL